MVKNASGKLKSATWEQALEAVAAKMGSIPAESMKAIAGKLSDAESVVALKDLFNRMGAGNTVVEGMEGRALTSVLTGCS
jgi:NADH dehydrogenase (ubiquinone) Fe-S protein 1